MSEVKPIEELTNKPGIKTTEFWVTLATSIVSVLVLSGVIKAQNVGPMNEAMVQIAGAVALIISNLNYIWSRASVKKEVVKQQIAFKIARINSGKC